MRASFFGISPVCSVVVTLVVPVPGPLAWTRGQGGPGAAGDGQGETQAGQQQRQLPGDHHQQNVFFGLFY